MIGESSGLAQGLERLSPVRNRGGALGRAVPTIRRYVLSAGGPVSTSGAHFVVSLVLLHTLPPAEFGLFSFLLIVVPFCVSLMGAMVGASFINGLRRAGRIEAGALATHLKVNLVLAAVSSLLVAGALALSGAAAGAGALLSVYGGVMALRWFGRSYCYASGQPLRVLASDLLYSAVLIAGVPGLLWLHRLTIGSAAAVLAAAAVLSFAGFGKAHFLRQFRPGREGSLLAYAASWRDLARWAVLGVVLTEFTANAHAYIVTFVAGPQAFAILALGSLVMRPASLVLSSLPDIERPRMAQKIGAGDVGGAFRTVKEFRTAAVAIWLGTLALAGGLLTWFPHVLLKKGYDADHAAIVIAIWGVILAVRTLRTPEAVFLQAAGEFRDLAGASLWASVASIAMTLGLLLLAGPIAALGGILAGDLVMTANIFALTRRWKRRHG